MALIDRGLVIDTPYIDRILSGIKTWEMRSTATKIRGRIALIRKGSGTVIGTAELVDCLGPFTDAQMMANQEKHRIELERIRSGQVAKWRYAWVVRDAHLLPAPVLYVHRPGAVIWVTLDDKVQQTLGER
ncbi:ASCH domain-containing protein [Kinneretia aquatilis]|uniref:ASCH domain-containing protein n=1 Tax=Kinneretia aquatilis TaxID=2070761 RepID=UPI001A9FAB2B|nr:ASCH domain-containing protein [Paucibacter aquatile]